MSPRNAIGGTVIAAAFSFLFACMIQGATSSTRTEDHTFYWSQVGAITGILTATAVLMGIGAYLLYSEDKS